MLEAIRYVDLIIPENDWEQKQEDIIKHNVNIFVMGNDWEGKFDFLKTYVKSSTWNGLRKSPRPG